MTNLTNMLCSNVLSSKRSIVVQVVALETLFCLHHSYTRGKHGQAKPRGQKVIEHAWIMSLTDISDACYYSPEQNALNYKWGPLSKCGANNTVAVIDLGCAIVGFLQKKLVGHTFHTRKGQNWCKHIWWGWTLFAAVPVKSGFHLIVTIVMIAAAADKSAQLSDCSEFDHRSLFLLLKLANPLV